MNSQPQGLDSLGAFFCVSLMAHAALLLSLWLFALPLPTLWLGAILGAKKSGAEVFLRLERLPHGSGSTDVGNPKFLLDSGGELPVGFASPSHQKPSQGDQRFQSDLGESNNQNGWNEAMLSSIFPSGRQSGFLGQTLPAGDPMGKLPPSFEWDMRRQSVQSHLVAQLDFMRIAFQMMEGMTCVVDRSKVSCSPADAGLSAFLYERFAQLNLIDPSLKSMTFISYGKGDWTCDIGD
ncbi:MAG: hypothetical protein EBZ60_00720 [Betaproteobacteria bacterium]|nr:hypothetical protein [Betaproteobacteria bacterium]